MEVAAQQPQRQEKVCRQQQNGQRGGQFQLSRRKGRHGADDTQPCAAVGHQVHQGDRVQLHGQHPHGDFAEAFGFGVHLLVLPAVGLINFQGGQPLNVLQKAVAQRGVLAPVAGQQLFGKLLHRHDGHGDQRHAAQQNNRRPRVHPHQQRKQGDRCQQAVEQLRQIFCKVGVDLLHALAGQHDHLAGSHRGGIAGAKAGELFIDLAAQGALDVPRCLIAHAGSQHGKGKAQRHRAKAEQDILPQHGSGQAARKSRPHQPCGRPDKDDITHQPQPLERHVCPNIAQRRPVEGQQFFVYHGCFSSSPSTIRS